MIIRQLNCNKAKLAHDNICQWLIRDTRPVLYLLQEPVYYKKRLASIPKGFQAYGERTSRAIIIAPDAANLIYVNQFSGDDITVCLINSGTIKRFIVSVYLDLHKDTIHPLLQKLADSLCFDRNSCHLKRISMFQAHPKRLFTTLYWNFWNVQKLIG